MKLHKLYIDEVHDEPNVLMRVGERSNGAFRWDDVKGWRYDGDLSNWEDHWPDDEIVSFDYLTNDQRRMLIVAVFVQDWSYVE